MLRIFFFQKMFSKILKILKNIENFWKKIFDSQKAGQLGHFDPLSTFHGPWKIFGSHLKKGADLSSPPQLPFRDDIHI